MLDMEILHRALNTFPKTSVSWLEEFCVKYGCARPDYVFKDHRKGPTSPPDFEATATVFNFDRVKFKVFGNGRAATKKSAKHRAATALLFRLGITLEDLMGRQISRSRSSSSSSTCGSETTSASGDSDRSPVVSEDDEQRSAISKSLTEIFESTPVVTELTQTFHEVTISPTICKELSDLCVRRRLRIPEYKELSVEGPSHQRSFYYECRIRSLNGEPDLAVTAVGTQKKKSINLSAATMLKVIQQKIFPHETNEEETVKQVISVSDSSSTPEAFVDLSTSMMIQEVCNNPHGSLEVDQLSGSLEGSGVDASSPNETELPRPGIGEPISQQTVQELLKICRKCGLPDPKFNKLKEDGPNHDKQFYYECCIKRSNGVHDLRTIANGSQIKKTKNVCAASEMKLVKQNFQMNENGCEKNKNIIIRLNETTEENKEVPSLVVTEQFKKPTNQISHRARKTLVTLCEERFLPNPEYNKLKEEGEDHNKLFYFECRIRNLYGQPDLIVNVVDTQEKLAMNLAAAEMIQLLQERINPSETFGKIIATLRAVVHNSY